MIYFLLGRGSSFQGRFDPSSHSAYISFGGVLSFDEKGEPASDGTVKVELDCQRSRRDRWMVCMGVYQGPPDYIRTLSFESRTKKYVVSVISAGENASAALGYPMGVGRCVDF